MIFCFPIVTPNKIKEKLFIKKQKPCKAIN